MNYILMNLLIVLIKTIFEAYFRIQKWDEDEIFQYLNQSDPIQSLKMDKQSMMNIFLYRLDRILNADH